MKLFHCSWLLSMLSYVIGGVFRRSESPVWGMSLELQGIAVFLLAILPAVVGIVLGVMSLKRKEVQAWLTVSIMLLNIATVLTSSLLLVPG